MLVLFNPPPLNRSKGVCVLQDKALYSKNDTEQSKSTHMSVFGDLDEVLYSDFEFVARHGGDNHRIELSS